MTKPNDEQQLLAWYYLQRYENGPYRIYNPNDVNSFVCEVCSIVEAETIVNSVNTRQPSPRAGLSVKQIEDIIEPFLNEYDCMPLPSYLGNEIVQAIHAAQPKDDGQAIKCLSEIHAMLIPLSKPTALEATIIDMAEKVLTSHHEKRKL